MSAPMSKVKKLTLSVFNGKMDKRKRLAVLGILLYIISPIDIVPDFIPMAGYADDVLLPILLIVAESLISDNKDKANDGGPDKRKDVTPPEK